MNTTQKTIDLSNLFGFDGLNIEDGQAIDFRNATASARLGAKIGKDIPIGGEITTDDAAKV